MSWEDEQRKKTEDKSPVNIETRNEDLKYIKYNKIANS